LKPVWTFSTKRQHNFPTICFYETGYNLFTLPQASRRSWRIGQKQAMPNPVLPLSRHDAGSGDGLMGKKLTAAQALEGRFSSEGLVAMAGERCHRRAGTGT